MSRAYFCRYASLGAPYVLRGHAKADNRLTLLLQVDHGEIGTQNTKSQNVYRKVFG